MSRGFTAPLSSEGLDHLFTEAVLAGDTKAHLAGYFADARAARLTVAPLTTPEHLLRMIEIQGGLIVPAMGAGILGLFACDVREERCAFEREFGI